MQHSTGSGNHHTVLYVTKLALTKMHCIDENAQLTHNVGHFAMS